MTFLGEEWRPGPDGLRFRHAARVLLFDDRDRLLLARGHDLHNPTRHWWFTIGGGREVGESDRAAAARELWEETGIRIPPAELVGPVLSRAAVFNFAAETVRQYEKFFLAHLTTPVELTTAGWSQIERDMIVDLRWWDLHELARADEQVYPEGLAAIATRLLAGWDGQVHHLGDVYDPQ